MIISSMLTLQLMTVMKDNSSNGDLKIDVQQEENDENLNKDLDQYDTPLFNEESQSLENKLHKKKEDKEHKVKNNLFSDQTGQSSRLTETKNQLFHSNKTSDGVDKAPYIQKRRERHLFPYFLICIGVFLTITFMIVTLKRKRES